MTPRVAHERLDAADVADGVVTLDRSSSNTLLACEQHVQLKSVQCNTEVTTRIYAHPILLSMHMYTHMYMHECSIQVHVHVHVLSSILYTHVYLLCDLKSDVQFTKQ